MQSWEKKDARWVKQFFKAGPGVGQNKRNSFPVLQPFTLSTSENTGVTLNLQGSGSGCQEMKFHTQS